MRRRSLVAAAAALPWLAVGGDEAASALAGAQWVGTSPERGHRLRQTHAGAWPSAAVQRRAQVLVVGAGVAGLAAARAFMRQGIDDVQVLELEDQPGGNSRSHRLAGMPCPLGAHYLPLPGPQAHEVSEWLHELGLLRQSLGRTVADERHLCHSPQERLFIDGAWVEGLLPPAAPGSATLAQYRRFAAEVARLQKEVKFALPSHRAPWHAGHQALDALPFGTWLDQHQFTDERLRWHLDYCCRDDYGADASVVSAWAGVHYFASRHGFHAPGDAEVDREPVFTWPEGNAWLTERLAAPLAGRLHAARTVLQVDEGRHGVQIRVWDEAQGRAETWQARTVVLAVPLWVAQRLLTQPPTALQAVLPLQRHAPWLVANLHIRQALLQRRGAAPAWDNVVYGRSELGYVDARHQSLDPTPGPTVLTAYQALPVAQRGALLSGSAPDWAQRVLAPLMALHPDLPRHLQQVALTRHGHAMSVPVPGLRGSPALRALRQQRGRLRFAHADLAAYSVFEEAFTLGCEAAKA